MNPWIYLCIAGIFEMLWAVSLKLSDSFTKIVPTIGFIIALILSMLFLSFSYRSIQWVQHMYVGPQLVL
ncbi:MAG: SMR family transporter [Methanobrevibacter boviskoreani]|nr:SMR family transporter [Methanobrevibacter boviskoreani]MDY5614128.1 SMR family transporter [Methanobrevibacter boviskoreani]